MGKKLFNPIAGLMCFCLLGVSAVLAQAASSSPISSSKIDLSTQATSSIPATGSSSVSSFSLSNKNGATFRSDFNTWSLRDTNGDGLEFNVNLTNPGMLQFSVRSAAAIFNGVADCPITISVNNTELTFANGTTTYTDTNHQWHQVFWNIPASMLNAGNNIITIALAPNATTQYFIQNASVQPRKLYSENGVLDTTIYAQFTSLESVTGIEGDGNVNPGSNSRIWSRSYGTVEGTAMIPGPTLHFKPGDLVNVTLTNLLDPGSATFSQFEKLAQKDGSGDEILDQDHLKGEINIPHNLNNTNLHVHGLHVDPDKDDVTIVIVPEQECEASSDEECTEGYDAPDTDGPTHHGHTDLNEWSVSDQSVKAGSWKYEYKIPDIHLPGTHWFHPHKHGATSAQVENGMAGTIVIEEDGSNAIVPYPKVCNGVMTGSSCSNSDQTSYKLKDWQDKHDRVLAVQEISNYGVQLGTGNSSGTVAGNQDITINGLNPYKLTLKSGQLERWRFVNAGTNHRAFSHIWLGRNTGKTTKVKNKNSKGVVTTITVPVYSSATMHLVAVDGITLSSKVPVTAEKPMLLAPGNRSDVLVKLTETTTTDYVVFKNYPTDIAISSDAAGENIIYNPGNVDGVSDLWAAAAEGSNPYLFAQTGVTITPGTVNANYAGFQQTWTVPVKGGPRSMIPLIKTKGITASDGSNLLDVDFALAGSFADGVKGKWQPQFGNGLGGGLINSSELINFKVLKTKVTEGSSPNLPHDDYLASIAPTTDSSPPSYVSPLTDKKILQSRPVVFDVAGVGINVCDPGTSAENCAANPTATVKQFSLNGRTFALNDPVGNPTANSIIKTSLSKATDLEYEKDIQEGNLTEVIQFADAGQADGNPSAWSNNTGTATDPAYYWTNPGYYQGLKKASDGSFSFDGNNTPTWTDVTGIANVGGVPQPSIINSKHANASNASPGLPYATTGEEWLLINNSDIGHPFHIHINPFFVVEVGQLSYEVFNGASDCGSKGENCEWVMRAITAPDTAQIPDILQRSSISSSSAKPTRAGVYQGDSDVAKAIVGNWWDTIIIPAHGYVKVRYWFNVPNQLTDTNQQIIVQDDSNKQGIWVYHCHILRHEDRGMMMPVITQAQSTAANFEAGPIWNDSDAKKVCTDICKNVGQTWNKQWSTTKVGAMSVCGCQPSSQ